MQGLSGAGNINIQMPGMGEMRQEMRQAMERLDRTLAQNGIKIRDIDTPAADKVGRIAYEGAKGFGFSRENSDNVQGIVRTATRQAVGTGRR